MTTSIDPDSEPTAEHQLHVGPEAADTADQQRHELDRRRAHEHTEDLLDEALDETFPASDPIAITPRKHDSI